jgi:cytoskeletal protein CcmA (bactofilin family)
MKIKKQFTSIWSREGEEEERSEPTDEVTDDTPDFSPSIDFLSEEKTQRKSEKRTFMKRDETHDLEEINSVVSRGSTFEGTFHVEGGMWIEGVLRGEGVCTGTLTVGQDGDVEANLRARDIVIAGAVVGAVEAEGRVTLRSTARLSGEVRAIALIVEEGAALKANCDIGEERLSFPLPDREVSIASSSMA